MAVDFLSSCRTVYCLNCVETHGVQVSLRATLHLVFIRSFFLLPGISVISTLHYLLLLGTRPDHFSRFFVTFLDTCLTVVVPLIYIRF